MGSTIDTTTGPRNLVAANALLDTWAEHSWSGGVRVDGLIPLDRVIIRTCHSTYEIIVLTPATAEVLVRGGAFFPEFTRVRVAGSSLGGSFLKLHSIHLGFRLEHADGQRSIVTSTVQTVAVLAADSIAH